MATRVIVCPKCHNKIEIEDTAPANTCPYCAVVLKRREPTPPAPQTAVAPSPEKSAKAANIGNTGSFFDGKLLQLIGINLLSGLLIAITLSIAAPWMLCMKKRWLCKHTVINGRRLVFDGTGGQLIGSWIKWILLSIITLCIYALWIPIKLEQWTVKHTSFAE